MSKQAVEIVLEYIDDAKQIVKFVGVLDAGRLSSVEMYGFAMEYQEGSALLNHYCCTLEAESDDCLEYTISWGFYNEDVVKIEFAARPVLVGHQVIRTDYDEKQPTTTIYKVQSITPLI